jgi:hypothetical protein
MKLALNIFNRIINLHVSVISPFCLTPLDFHQGGPAVAGRSSGGQNWVVSDLPAASKYACGQVAMTLYLQQVDERHIFKSPTTFSNPQSHRTLWN